MTGLSTIGATLLGTVLLLYVVGLIGLGRWASGRVDDSSDFLLAGRSVPLGLSIFALLATWFGSSAIVGATRNTYEYGLSGTVLEPFACAATLVLTGLLFAKPLWEMQVSTVADLFRERLGHAAEWISCAIQVPTFFCWIGAQYLSIGALLETYLRLPSWLGILGSAMVCVLLLWSGGMWAVTWTNSVMIALSIVSVLWLGVATAMQVGEGNAWRGIEVVAEQSAVSDLSFLPDPSWGAGLAVLGVFLTGLFGNIPGQDLQQRVLSSRSPSVARWSCIVSGALYLMIGLIPVYVGLAAKLQLQNAITAEDVAGDRVLPIAAAHFLNEPVVILLVIGLLSVNLAVAASSTLSQTAILSSNLLRPLLRQGQGSVPVDRACVVAVTAGSVLAAFSGESVMGLLEISLAMVMVSLFAPMCWCLFGRPVQGWAGAFSMLVGVAVWGLHALAPQWLGPDDGATSSAVRFWLSVPGELQGLLASVAIVSWVQFRHGQTKLDRAADRAPGA